MFLYLRFFESGRGGYRVFVDSTPSKNKQTKPKISKLPVKHSHPKKNTKMQVAPCVSKLEDPESGFRRVKTQSFLKKTTKHADEADAPKYKKRNFKRALRNSSRANASKRFKSELPGSLVFRAVDVNADQSRFCKQVIQTHCLYALRALDTNKVKEILLRIPIISFHAATSMRNDRDIHVAIVVGTLRISPALIWKHLRIHAVADARVCRVTGLDAALGWSANLRNAKHQTSTLMSKLEYFLAHKLSLLVLRFLSARCLAPKKTCAIDIAYDYLGDPVQTCLEAICSSKLSVLDFLPGAEKRETLKRAQGDFNAIESERLLQIRKIYRLQAHSFALWRNTKGWDQFDPTHEKEEDPSKRDVEGKQESGRKGEFKWAVDKRARNMRYVHRACDLGFWFADLGSQRRTLDIFVVTRTQAEPVRSKIRFSMQSRRWICSQFGISVDLRKDVPEYKP